ncbi:MAG: hypothetical protein P1R74_15300 [Sedimenticola sp.]|nr:hypothetical protein [Sedimenticola sp.]
MIAESINGTIRQLFIAPSLGDLPAHQIGLLIGSAIIFLISISFIRWIGARSFGDQFRVGLLWVVLIVIFEFSLGGALGYSWKHMLADYNIADGGYMPLGLLFLLFAPALAAKARGFR